MLQAIAGKLKRELFQKLSRLWELMTAALLAGNAGTAPAQPQPVTADPQVRHLLRPTTSYEPVPTPAPGTWQTRVCCQGVCT